MPQNNKPRISEMCTLVTIEQPSGEQDSAGQITGWATFTKLYAKIEPLSGKELLSFKQLVSPVNVRLRTRYAKGITPNMRVVFDNREMNIDAVVDTDNKHAYLEIFCVEVQ